MSGMGLLAFALWGHSRSPDGKAPQKAKAE
jgi:hypothetical protein